MGDGEKLVRMRRLREEKESVPEQDEENTDMIRRIGGDPVLAQVGDEQKGGTEKAENAVAQLDGGGQGVALSAETTERSGAVETPCASPNGEAPQSSEDGFFGDLFKAVVEDEATPIAALTASLPDVSVDELLAEAAKIRSMARRTPRGGT